MMEGKWMYNCCGSDIWQGEEFETKDEAIKAGKEETVGRYFEVGQIEKVDVADIDVDFILENIANDTTAEVGEVGEGYLEDVSTEHRLELEESLNDVLFEWIKKHGYDPGFFKVSNIETIYIK